jgi:hypothetical protein
MANKQALVDSGATNNFMHLNFAKRMGLEMKALPNPKRIFNIDNMTNKAGMITHYLELNVITKGIHIRTLPKISLGFSGFVWFFWLPVTPKPSNPKTWVSRRFSTHNLFF